MKKGLISLGATMLIVGIILTTNTANVHAENVGSSTSTEEISDDSHDGRIIFSGQEGPEDNPVMYKLTDDGTLHIYGGTVGANGVPFAIGMNDEYKPLVTKISFDGNVIAQDSTSNFFKNFKNLSEISNLKNFDTSNTTDMSNMFSGLKALKVLDLTGLNTSKVTNMQGMFSESNFESLNLLGLDTSSVITMQSMFSGTTLNSLNLSKFNVSNVNNMSFMFSNMSNLNSIDVSGWKFKDGVSMMQLFSGDSKLTTVDLSTWNNQNANATYYLMNSSIDRITVSKDTSLKNSYIGLDISTGEAKFPGYWININNPDKLINAQDFAVGADEYDGTYVHVVPSDTVTSDVTFKSNKGDQISKDQSITISDLLNINDEFDIKVPTLSGYKANKVTVKGKLSVDINDDGKVTYKIVVVDPDDSGYITYTSDGTTNPSTPNHSGSSSSRPNTIDIEHLVTTHPYNGSVSLYKLNGDKVSNRALAQNSDWFSDQEMTRNGIKYYRVATNEWVKARDIYVYENKNLTIGTRNDVQYLTTSQGETILNRALAADTNWQVDKLAYINGKSFYRVATNEFVPVDSVSTK